MNLDRINKMNREELIQEIIKLEIDAKRRKTNNHRLRQKIKNLVKSQKEDN